MVVLLGVPHNLTVTDAIMLTDFWRLLFADLYEGVYKIFRTESITKYILTTISTR
jgi:hypothetical protein